VRRHSPLRSSGGVKRVSDALGEIFIEKVAAEQWQELACTDMLFQNMNTPEDFVEVRRRIVPLV
jgi:hypothetical protein